MTSKDIQKLSLDQKLYNCAGIILFNENFTETILVETESGHYSFPKGKREKNESLFKTAVRETVEETGINSDKYYLSDFVLAEFKKQDSKTPSVLYFIGQLLEKVKTFTFDQEELKNVKWVSVQNALKMDNSVFKEQRQKVLAKALLEVKESDFKLHPSSEIETSLIPKKREMTAEEQEKKHLTSLSKLLSWILRHGINEMGLQMNSEGYVSVDELLKLEKLADLSFEDLVKVVNDNKKQRFKLITGKDSKSFIRANQGHSVNIGNALEDDKMMKKLTLDDGIFIGYHGTSLANWELIKETGLKPCDRKHCHLSRSYQRDNEETISGIRDHSQVIIKIDVKKGLEVGQAFYLSDNNVILTSFISPDLLERVK
jgi:RNA:NAD 2'-phosphotransferase (TPT1/KptA family)/8-oxo-dGTP pyrophosphatase MutT (NUDIX family)